MSQKWTNNAGDTGILRKSEFKDKKEELFVFGYSCKLFRDDEKALLIDQGKHLIPWMGDETLKIDRYDARGALHDLSKLEAPSGGYDWRVELTKQELDVEQLCDEERYRALHTDEDEEEMYKEEELKRLHKAGYGQVGFNYDTPPPPPPSEQPVEIDEPFEPTASFKALFSADILLPDTQKQNAIIEKTAKFIAAQGAQMEILIKAKQGDNPQFNFLNRDSNLHPYYIALIGLIKAGKWPEKEVEVVEEKPENEDYLHPSLASTVIESAPSIPSIHYKPSADCDYTLLISKMRGDSGLDEVYNPELAPGEVAPPGTEPLPPLPAVTTAAAAAAGTQAGEISRAPVMYNPNTPDAQNNPAQAAQMAHYQQQYVLYYQQYMAAVQMGIRPQLPQTSQNPLIAAHVNQIPQSGQMPQIGQAPQIGQIPIVPTPPPEIGQTQPSTESTKPGPTKSTGLSLMKNYASDSDSDVSDYDDSSSSDSKQSPAIITPSHDVQVVIDKMAAYVARNGDEFAEIVRAKNDSRFTFLEPDNIYHPYYVKLMRQKRGIDVNGDEKPKERTKQKKGSLVSFSIKKAKEPDPILPKPALPYESSSEEESENKEKENQDKAEENSTNMQENGSDIKTNIPTIQSPNPLLLPQAVVYKMEQSDNILPVIKTIEQPPAPLIKTPNTIAAIEKPKQENSPQPKTPPKEVLKERTSEQKQAKKEEKRDKESPTRKEKKRHKDKKKEHKRRDRIGDREKKKDRDYKEKKKRRYSKDKDELENEIISLEDNSDELIDLTGDLPDSKAETDLEVERAKKAERRRRAAEFLRQKAGLDPSAALPTSSLASAMVDTIESLQKKKKAEEEERRKRKEKRKQRERYEYEEVKSHRKSKRRRNRSSDDEDSDYESKKKKRKKDKKHTSKNKKKRKKESKGESEEDVEDHPLNIDLTNTLKELRTKSPTKELELQEEPQVVIRKNDKSSSDHSEDYQETDKELIRKKKKEKDREYSEGEWSSDSEVDSKSTSSKDDD